MITKHQKREFIEQTIDAAIIQASECSGLRSWLIAEGLAHAENIKEDVNEEMWLQSFFDILMDKFSEFVPVKFHDEQLISTIKDYGPNMPWRIAK